MAVPEPGSGPRTSNRSPDRKLRQRATCGHGPSVGASWPAGITCAQAPGHIPARDLAAEVPIAGRARIARADCTADWTAGWPGGCLTALSPNRPFPQTAPAAFLDFSIWQPQKPSTHEHAPFSLPAAIYTQLLESRPITHRWGSNQTHRQTNFQRFLGELRACPTRLSRVD